MQGASVAQRPVRTFQGTELKEEIMAEVGATAHTKQVYSAPRILALHLQDLFGRRIQKGWKIPPPLKLQLDAEGT